VRHWQVIVSIGFWFLLTMSALAQTGSIQVIDPDGVLGPQSDAVRQAAERLANEGAQVIILAAGTSAGMDGSSAEQYLDQVLLQNNLAPSSAQLNPNQIVFFVAQDAQYSALFYGGRWRQVLDPVYQRIIDQQMNPRFAEGNIAGGLVAGIDAARTQINPPTPTFVYVLGAVLVGTVAALLVVPRLRQRRETAAALARARERMAQARRAAGAAIVDLNQRMETARAKAQYDQLSYSSADVQHLQALQQEAEQAFNEAQFAFKAAEDRSRAQSNLNAGDYAAISQLYERVQEQTRRANTVLEKVERMRAQLDTQNAPSTGPTRRLGDS
jgi:hypothetical protein